MSKAFKSGAVLNSANLPKIKDALNLLNEVMNSHTSSHGAGKSKDDTAQAAEALATLQECAKAGPAARRMVRKGLEMLVMKASNVIGYKKEVLADVDANWDGGAEVKAATIEDLKAMCAWYDSSQTDNKGSYKLPHHTAKGHETVFKAVASAMVALNGGRTPINIPAADKPGVYKHLVKHYKDFDKPAPELKA